MSCGNDNPGRRARLGRTLAGLLVVGALATAVAGCATTTPGWPRPVIPAELPQPTPPPPVSIDDYQQALTDIDNAVGPAFGQLAGAQTPAAISAAVDAASAALNKTLASLRDLVPPTVARAANDNLLTGLGRLVGDLGPVADAASHNQVCLGSAALALLSRSDDLDQLRGALTLLATADPGNPFRVAGFLPPVTQDTDRAAPNGSIVTGGTGRGLGTLTITNGGDTDATVGLVPDQATAPAVSVYVAHGATFTLNGIRDAVYQVFVTTGHDWDAGARLFARDCQFQHFDDPLRYATTRTQYTTGTLSLTPVPGGTATVSAVDPAAFPH